MSAIPSTLRNEPKQNSEALFTPDFLAILQGQNQNETFSVPPVDKKLLNDILNIPGIKTANDSFDQTFLKENNLAEGQVVEMVFKYNNKSYFLHLVKEKNSDKSIQPRAIVAEVQFNNNDKTYRLITKFAEINDNAFMKVLRNAAFSEGDISEFTPQSLQRLITAQNSINSQEPAVVEFPGPAIDEALFSWAINEPAVKKEVQAISLSALQSLLKNKKLTENDFELTSTETPLSSETSMKVTLQSLIHDYKGRRFLIQLVMPVSTQEETTTEASVVELIYDPTREDKYSVKMQVDSKLASEAASDAYSENNIRRISESLAWRQNYFVLKKKP